MLISCQHVIAAARKEDPKEKTSRGLASRHTRLKVYREVKDLKNAFVRYTHILRYTGKLS